MFLEMQILTLGGSLVFSCSENDFLPSFEKVHFVRENDAQRMETTPLILKMDFG